MERPAPPQVRPRLLGNEECPHLLRAADEGCSGFEDGIGTLLGDDELNGRKVRVRSQWSRIATKSPRWEQATSVDGKTWDTNWSADFEREA